ncbi:MAG: hypothetical protein QOF62_2930 [Pyrinomonadaceae bacterium]|jgi:hypothetical protein|nr:hypothetical protein [Pyrinomonadaceae bacterium]
MRTTVELPPQLMKQAKARAAAKGESLKTLLTRAVATELGRARHPGENGSRIELPLFGDLKAKPIDISNEDIARALTAQDIVRPRRRDRRSKK